MQPQDIDKVRQGLTAAIRFPAFDAQYDPAPQRARCRPYRRPSCTGQQGKTYFTARVEISATEIERIASAHKLVPGMPAEVYIQTASRSILSYFLKPLVDAMARSFRD